MLDRELWIVLYLCFGKCMCLSYHGFLDVIYFCWIELSIELIGDLWKSGPCPESAHPRWSKSSNQSSSSLFLVSSGHCTVTKTNSRYIVTPKCRITLKNIQNKANNWYILIFREHFPEDKYPPLSSLQQNISIVLSNHHFSEGPIRPDVPAVVEIGGIQINDKISKLPDVSVINCSFFRNGFVYIISYLWPFGVFCLWTYFI